MTLLAWIAGMVLYIGFIGALARVGGFNDWIDPPAPEERESVEREAKSGS